LRDALKEATISSTIITIIYFVMMVFAHESTHTAQSLEFGCTVMGYKADWSGIYTMVNWSTCPDVVNEARLANSITEAFGYQFIAGTTILVFILSHWWIYYLVKSEG
jgi:hypothetical protein